ncbi:MAG: PRC-barrel domain-containing protein [Alphaproteobacteria bacterium]
MAVPPPPWAGGAPHIPPFDAAALATGIRASRVMGKAVQNEAGEDVGTINDLVIDPSDSAPYVIIGVGGFLGVGERLVAVPFGILVAREGSAGLVLPGATKDSVRQLPEFRFPPRGERPPPS